MAGSGRDRAHGRAWWIGYSSGKVREYSGGDFMQHHKVGDLQKDDISTTCPGPQHSSRVELFSWREAECEVTGCAAGGVLFLRRARGGDVGEPRRAVLRLGHVVARALQLQRAREAAAHSMRVLELARALVLGRGKCLRGRRLLVHRLGAMCVVPAPSRRWPSTPAAASGWASRCGLL